MQPNPFLSKNAQLLPRKKEAQNFGLLLNKNNLPKVNSLPICEKSANLITLAAVVSTARQRQVYVTT
jgi:hypothetical protein